MLLTCVSLFPSWAVSPPDAADAAAARHLCWLRSARLVTVTCFSSSLEPSCFEVASLRPETVFARLPHFELMRQAGSEMPPWCSPSVCKHTRINQYHQSLRAPRASLLNRSRSHAFTLSSAALGRRKLWYHYKMKGVFFIPLEPTCPADAALGVFGSDGCTPVWARLSLISAALLLTVWNLLF